LVYRIYKELTPYADVRWNDHIWGTNSKTSRQIDISIRTKVANHEILIIIQAKDLKRAADVNIVGTFESVIKDVGAQKGILICNTGFTRPAKEAAKAAKVDLCSAHDASTVNWQTEIQVPVIKRSINVKLTIRHSYVRMGPAEIKGIELPNPKIALDIFLEKWQRDEISKEAGKHTIQLSKELMSIDNTDLWPLGSEIEYEIGYRYHFKFFTPSDYRGIKDYISKNFTPSFIEFNERIPFLNDGTWVYVPDPSVIPLNSLHLNIEIVQFDMLRLQMLKIDLIN
jgi:hypothetical protein